ncbi:MAG TPA: OsmC family protein [Gemmatimonadaceae bacterium]|nr:OsmC family protein [Gemmatimonadaceae bacterium]
MSAPTASPSATPTVAVRAVWRGERRFDTGPAGRTVVLDGDSRVAPGPVEMLAGALATCAGIDVVDILAKRRTPVEHFAVEVTAERRAEPPRRLQRVLLEFSIDGSGIELAQAQRAVHLSFEKYCSVAASLAADISVTARITLNGRRSEEMPLEIWTAARAR